MKAPLFCSHSGDGSFSGSTLRSTSKQWIFTLPSWMEIASGPPVKGPVPQSALRSDASSEPRLPPVPLTTLAPSPRIPGLLFGCSEFARVALDNTLMHIQHFSLQDLVRDPDERPVKRYTGLRSLWNWGAVPLAHVCAQQPRSSPRLVQESLWNFLPSYLLPLPWGQWAGLNVPKPYLLVILGTAPAPRSHPISINSGVLRVP